MEYNGEVKKVVTLVTGIATKTCYLTADDTNGSYEYAIIDDKEKRIICIFTQYDGWQRVPEECQLKSLLVSDPLGQMEAASYSMYWFGDKKEIRTMPERSEP